VNKSLDKYFATWPNLTIISEPGAYFAMPSVCVAAEVFARKKVKAIDLKRDANATDSGFVYYLTDGVYGSFSQTLVYNQFPKFVAVGKDISTNTSVQRYASRIWGPTCDCADLLYSCVDLPEIEIGTWLVFQGMGAYAICFAADFNGIAVPTSHYVITETDKAYITHLQGNNAVAMAMGKEFSCVKHWDSGISLGSDKTGDVVGLITHMNFA